MSKQTVNELDEVTKNKINVMSVRQLADFLAIGTRGNVYKYAFEKFNEIKHKLQSMRARMFTKNFQT